MSAITADTLLTAAVPAAQAETDAHAVERARGWLGLAVGIGFGFLLGGSRVYEYEVIHNALLLRDPYVFLLMGAAVATAAPLLWLLRRRKWVTPIAGPLDVPRFPVRRGHLAGSAVFGAGWAITGSCPGPAIAATASGGLLGAAVMAGLFAGVSLHDGLAARRGAASAPALGPCDPPQNA